MKKVTDEDIFRLRSALSAAMPDILKTINRSNSPAILHLLQQFQGLALRDYPMVRMNLTLQGDWSRPQLIGFKFELKPEESINMARKYMIVKSKSENTNTVEIVPRADANRVNYTLFDFDPTSVAERYVNDNGGSVEVWVRLATVKSARAVVERDPV